MNGSQRQRFQGSTDPRKERDDDLLLFRELFKREEQRNSSLLQPVSEEFEASQGNIKLYKMTSVKGGGYEFLEIDGEKTDYDWLKTPPATPLFTSIELESNEHNMAPYKEMPTLKPVKTSRFAGKAAVGPKPNNKPKSPSSRSASSSHSASSSRSVTPNRRSRPNSSSGNYTANGNLTRTLKEALNFKQRPSPTLRKNPNLLSSSAAARIPGSATSTPKKQTEAEVKIRSRGASPIVRSKLPSGFSGEAPPNLITSVGHARSSSVVASRATSATRRRPVAPAEEAKVEGGKSRRKSCSPGASRGRRPAAIGSDGGRAATGGSAPAIGSRMVEKLMSARRSGGAGEENSDSKPKQRAAVTAAAAGAGFGRLTTTRASLNVSLNKMEIRNSSVDNQPNTGRAKVGSNTKSIDPSMDAKSFRTRRNLENRLLVKKGDAKNGF